MVDCRPELNGKISRASPEIRNSLPSTKYFVDNYETIRSIARITNQPTMKKPSLPKPTDSELAILRVLWRLGPGTVRAVHDELNRTQETGYTTVLKMLQIMTEKGLVRRDESTRSHVYEPIGSEQQVQRQLVAHLLERAFGGSAQKLVLQALSTKKASPSELKEIRKLLDDMEGGAK
jgi:predicted transcriptional regulator